MTRPQQPHPLRCETCGNRAIYSTFPFRKPCPIVDYDLLNPDDITFIVEQIGCASHTSAPAREQPRRDWVDSVIKELANRRNKEKENGFDNFAKVYDDIISLLQAQQPPAPAADAPIGMSSEDLLLLAHDEWLRREKRKGNHPESHWVTGFIGGILTDRKWAREYVAALREGGELR